MAKERETKKPKIAATIAAKGKPVASAGMKKKFPSITKKK